MRRPALNKYIIVSRIIEQGTDFIMRPYMMRYSSLGSFDNADEDWEIPEFIETARQEVRKAVEEPVQGNEAIIVDVLKKSVLEAYHETYIDAEKKLLIIAEPCTTLDHLEKWT
jgi:hypothetical protein